jgi:hypothetical protein
MRKAWLIFGAVQATGIGGVLVGLLLQDGIVLFLYSAFLLPGSLLLLLSTPLASSKIELPLWFLYPAALAINALLFAGILAVVARSRKFRPSVS